jgi:hypothetical protein
MVLKYFDDIKIIKSLIQHMVPNFGDFHIFLSLINNPKNNVWFQAMINVNGNAFCFQMKQMTKAIKLKHNYTNYYF